MIEQLKTVGMDNIILVVFILIALIPTIIDSWKKFLSALGLVRIQDLKDQTYEETIKNLKEALKEVQNDIYEKQSGYHKESVNIRNRLEENQECLKKNQESLQSALSELKKSFNDYMKMDNKRTVASFRNDLWLIHGECMKKKFATPEELKVFSELGKIYEEAGGDDIFHEKLKPEIMALPVCENEQEFLEKFVTE